MFSDQSDYGRKDCFPGTGGRTDDHTFIRFNPPQNYTIQQNKKQNKKIRKEGCDYENRVSIIENSENK